MRRHAMLVTLALAALILAVSPMTASIGRAQDASAADLPPFLVQFLDAVSTGDGAAVAALYTEDGVHEDVANGIEAQGSEEIAAFVNGLFERFPDARLEAVSGHHAGDLAILEYMYSGTYPEADEAFSVRGVLVFIIEGDAIVRSADYFDRATVLEQLGVLESGDAVVAAAAAS